ncbi:MAG: porin [Gallionellaceae bacterium]|jgi:predicted porin
MNKKIIALVVATVFSAPAFAEVSTYGIIDAAAVYASGKGQQSDLIGYSGGLSGSRFGAKVTEDLGNGLTAVGVLEYALDTQIQASSANLKARQQMLAVAGDFGTVAAGYLQTAAYDFAGKFDPLSGSAISPYQSIAAGGGFLVGSTTAAARAQRALAYISPNISGLTVAVNYTTSLDNALGNLGKADNATTGLKTSAYLLSGTYVLDVLTVGAVYAGASSDNAGSTSSSDLAVGASYDLGIAKVMGTFQMASAGSVTNTAYSLSGVMPVGEHAVAASFAMSSMDAADSNGTGLTVGYLHNLSKTATAYAAFETVSNGNATHAYSVANNALSAATLTNGGGSTLIAIGLRKKF